MAAPLFKIPLKEYGILFTETWTKHLWKFIWGYEIILEIEEQFDPPIMRYGDRYLVEWFRSLTLVEPVRLGLG